LAEELDPKQFRKCLNCGEIIVRRKLKNHGGKLWDTRRYCNDHCRIRGQSFKFHQNVKHSSLGRFKGIARHFICPICEKEIIGKIRDLKDHKYNEHSQDDK